MEGHSVISPDVLARYAADAAAEVQGVHTKQRRGARVTGGEVEVHLVVDYGADIPHVAARCSATWPTTSGAWPTSFPAPSTSSSTTSSARCRRASPV